MKKLDWVTQVCVVCLIIVGLCLLYIKYLK